MLEHWTDSCISIFRAFYLVRIVDIMPEFVITQHGTQIGIEYLECRQQRII